MQDSAQEVSIVAGPANDHACLASAGVVQEQHALRPHKGVSRAQQLSTEHLQTNPNL